LLTAVAAAHLPAHAAGGEPRPLLVDDLFALREVSDPRLSPDGAWVAFVVTRLDAEEDETDADVYMAPLAGGESVRLTSGKRSETAPRFSPDGRFLAFLAGRDEKPAQVFLLDRRGGEAIKLTDAMGGVSDLAWSPDGRRLALIVSDPDTERTGEQAKAEQGAKEKKKPLPIVLRRLQFVRDGEGYLRERRKHIHVFDVETKASVQVTSGPFDDSEPAWSPDGRLIAFTSNRTWPDADVDENTDVFVVAPQEGAIPRRLTTSPGSDSAPAFSPDGRSVAHVAGGNPKDIYYDTSHVAVVPLSGGTARPLTKSLDRNVLTPRFAPDGRAILFLVEDGGNKHLCRVPAGGGAVERVVAGERDVMAFDVAARGGVAVLESTPHQPAEVSAVTSGGLKRVSHVNDVVLAGLRLGPVERFKAKSPDGTMIDGFLTRPPDAQPGRKLPAILRIHGGPVDQFSTEFNFQWQALAAQGYAVVAANPRGSSGYGRDFSYAIWADWGRKDLDDVIAAVDHVVAMGVADPERLGVGGWSYGGMLTNYAITRSSRFKAAITGASEANYLADYGTDHYQYIWEAELGLPWRNRDLWIRLSPWFDVEKVTAPTLILCGDEDRNVPLLNSEQLYQALRRLGKEVELVVYPGEDHSIDRPSFQKDRLERYIAWYDQHLKPEGRPGVTAKGSPAEAVSLLGVPLIPRAIAADQRKTLEADLARAATEVARDPGSVDALIWVGRRTAYLGRYSEAVAVFSSGIAAHPNDARLYRHRGHRYITLRELDKAVADLTRASTLIAGVPDQVEPDGIPNARNQPTSTTHFNVWYHLGLAHYLEGDFEHALTAYRECLKVAAGSPDRLVAASDWLYLTLRRLGRDEEARQALAPIRKDLDVFEDHAYLNRLLMYKGELRPEDLLAAGGGDVARPTYEYAVGVFSLLNGQRDHAQEIFERIVKGPRWDAFGFIAAEAELARMRKP
jgi:dipeptidyl aminopeptidase/acylaminoacyl peptidase/Flp pilus assembly protein TadD